jgi:hypothetical protein
MNGRVTLSGPGGLLIFLLVAASVIGTCWLVGLARKRSPRSPLARVAFWALVAAFAANGAASFWPQLALLVWAVLPFQVVSASCATAVLVPVARSPERIG